MATTYTYIGVKETLHFFKGVDTDAFVFTIQNADGTAYSFTGIIDQYLKIYTDETRSILLATITDGLVDGSGLRQGESDQGANEIELSIDDSVDLTDISVGEYYYELTWVNASSKPITVNHGPAIWD